MFNPTHISYDNMHRVGQFGLETEIMYDVYMKLTDIRSHYNKLDNEVMHEGESPNTKAQKFYDMLASTYEPIYEGAMKSRLSITLRLMIARTDCYTAKKCLDYFIQILLDVDPIDNCIFKNYYEAKKYVSSLGLKAMKIDCCEVR